MNLQRCSNLAAPAAAGLSTKQRGAWRRRLLRSVLAVAACALAGGAGAAEIQERSFKLAFTQAIDSHWGLGGKRFAELVAHKSGGKMQVKPVTDKYVKELGEPLVQELQRELAKARGK
jgi:TRAP-type C4-dicarboxylate transport system substrate-binding protein